MKDFSAQMNFSDVVRVILIEKNEQLSDFWVEFNAKVLQIYSCRSFVKIGNVLTLDRIARIF